MRILITNNTLAGRAGSELYVRDIALALQNRGHTPIAYSTKLGDVADELRRATIPVIDDLTRLPFRPDLIHGQHHLDTMTALLSLPGVPAVYFCHGWMPWEEIPPLFPRILRYVAVDNTCLERVIYEQCIPAEKVRVMFNFVDLKRFQPRAPLPPKPQRALYFSNYACEDEGLKIIREACARFQIQLDVIGLTAGNSTSQPEITLPQYDLVFARGRSALEAMAVGAAVIVCDVRHCGPLVSTANFDQLRRLNFGIRTLRTPLSVEHLALQIEQYNSDEAARVSQLVRQQAGLEQTVDQLVQLYEEVIAEFKRQPASDPVAELQAAGAYLQTLSPHLKKVLNGILDQPAPPPAPLAPPAPPAPPQKQKPYLRRVLKALRGR
jgi:hypothetical protein